MHGYGVMEAEKFHGVQSVNWRSKKAGDIIQPQCEGLRIRGQWCQLQVQSKGLRTRRANAQGGRIWMSQHQQRAKGPSSAFLFNSGPPKDWMTPTHMGEGGLLIQMLISSRDILTDTPQNNVYQLSRHPLD